MKSIDVEQRRDWRSTVSRRGLLQSAAALAAVQATNLRAGDDDAGDGQDDDEEDGRSGTALAYFGCYTNHGRGIYLFSVNLGNGALTQLNVFTGSGTSNPSWITLDPSHTHLYAVNENSPGTVSAFSIDRPTGNLTFLNTVSSQGNGPAHMSIDPSGRYALVANYGSGNVAVIRLNPDGSLGFATSVKNDASACSPACPVGPMMAAKAPTGSFAISGHEAAHAHMIQTDPAGNFVMVNDLGLDLTIVWRFDNVAGTLSDPQTFPSSPGAGPRHFAFHPNGRWFYSLNEEASTLAFATYDATHGTLHFVDEIQTLPAAFVGTNFTSEVQVSHDGRHVYCANRLHDTIAVFAIEGSGAPRLVGEAWTRGDYPRSFTINPSGRFLYVCNHRGDSVTTFRISEEGRELRFTGGYTAIGSPAVMVFL